MREWLGEGEALSITRIGISLGIVRAREVRHEGRTSSPMKSTTTTLVVAGINVVYPYSSFFGNGNLGMVKEGVSRGKIFFENFALRAKVKEEVVDEKLNRTACTWSLMFLVTF